MSEANNPAAKALDVMRPLIQAEVARQLELYMGNVDAGMRQLGENQTALYQQQQYLEELILSQNYPNTFAINADDAYRRFIRAEWERVGPFGLEEDGEEDGEGDKGGDHEGGGDIVP